MDARKMYWVKWLDFRYLGNFDHLNFKYLTYEVMAINEEEAIERARDCYMRGEKEIFSEEVPFLLKLFSVSHMEVKSPADIFKASGYLGSFKGKKNVSTSYKDRLTDSLREKFNPASA